MRGLPKSIATLAQAGKLKLHTRDQGKPGGQIGLRWTVADGKVDLDLIGGRYVDGATPGAVTVGVTFRE